MKNQRPPASFATVFLAATLCLLAGCASPAFNKNWKDQARSVPPHDLVEGAWTGTWRSKANGHHGRLRCLVTKLEGNHYRFYYDARFWGIFGARYTVTQEVQQAGAALRVRGESDLGRLFGGVFMYEGQTDGKEFRSSYRSTKDHGVFELVRPKSSQ